MNYIVATAPNGQPIYECYKCNNRGCFDSFKLVQFHYQQEQQTVTMCERCRDYLKRHNFPMKELCLYKKNQPLTKRNTTMDNNNKKKEKIIPDFIQEIIEAGRNHVDTPSEKICKLSLDRDKIYDKVKKLEKDLETSKENNEDCTFLEAQLQHLKDYKKLLGDQIKKLVDET